MMKIVYSPESRHDLRNIRKYVKKEFGEDVEKRTMSYITTHIRTLGKHSKLGRDLSQIVPIICDYKYLYIRQNYVFYRIEGNHIRIIRVLNEKQDFMQILFGLNTTSEESEKYWNDDPTV